MAKTPFLAKDGIATPLDIDVGGKISLTTVNQSLNGIYSNGSKLSLIRTEGNSHVIGQFSAQMGSILLKTPQLIHNPAPGSEFRVYTEGNRPLISDLIVGSLLTEDPTRLWVNSYVNDLTKAPTQFSDVVNLSSDAGHGLQLAGGYSTDDTLLYFRTRSDNNTSVKGRGLQTWHRLYHTGFKPTALELGALSIKEYALNHKQFTGVIQKDKWSRLFKAAPFSGQLAGSFQLAIYYTRGNLVVNNTFNITFGHNNCAMIITTGAHGYSNVKLRVTQVDLASNDRYIELMDLNTGLDFTDQLVYVTLNSINAVVTPYTEFTDGSVPYAVLAETTTENYTLKINNNKLWHQGNDGTGSGLDADLLDGIDSTGFVNTTTDQTINGKKQFSESLVISNQWPALRLHETEETNTPKWALIADNGILSFRLNNLLDYPFVITTNVTHDSIDRIDITAPVVKINNGIVWHSLNDGVDSGLDADLLDGKHSTDFGLLIGDQSWLGNNKFTKAVFLDNSADLYLKAIDKDAGDLIFCDKDEKQIGRVWSAENVLTFSSTPSTTVTDPGIMQLTKDHLYYNGKPVFHDAFRDVAMTKSQFNAIRALNIDLYAASGFIHLGKHHTITASGDSHVNEGLSTWDSAKDPSVANMIALGKRNPIVNAVAGTSKTEYAVINVNGVTINVTSLYGAFPTHNYCLLRFPPAPNGLTTYNKRTGENKTYNTAAEAFATVTDDVEVVTDRVDLSAFEVFLEEVTALNPFVYPNGLIQSTETTMNGISTLPANRPLTYFAMYDGDITITGLGVNFFASTVDQQRLMLADHKNNLFFGENGRLYQWRCRVRTFAGPGNGDWINVETGHLSYGPLFSYESNIAAPACVYVAAQGIRDICPNGGVTTQWMTGWYTSSRHQYNTDLGNNRSLGHFIGATTDGSSSGGIDGSYDLSANRECYLLPICTVKRLNQGAYHPSLNASGTEKVWTGLPSGDTGYWYQHTYLKTKADCFNKGQFVGSVVNGVYGAHLGASGVPAFGRTDNRCYDAIYAEGDGGIQLDLRLKATGVTKTDITNAEYQVNTGIYRGTEELGYTKIFSNQTVFIVNANGGEMDISGNGAGPFIAGSLKAGTKVSFLSKDASNLFVTGYVMLSSNAVTIHITSKRGSMTDGFYSGWLVIQFTENTYRYENRVIVENINVPVGSVGGNFSHVDVVGHPVNILAIPALVNGWRGRYGSVFPDGTPVQPVILTRKNTNSAMGATVKQTYTSDGGATWSQSNTPLKFANNSVDMTSFTGVVIYEYPAFATQTEPTVTEAVHGGQSGINRLLASSSSSTDYSVLLGESLCGIICKNDSVSQAGLFAVKNINIDQYGMISNKAWNTPNTHLPLTLATPTNNSPAFKALTYDVNLSQQASIQYAYTELRSSDITYTTVTGTTYTSTIATGEYIYIAHPLMHGYFQKTGIAYGDNEIDVYLTNGFWYQGIDGHMYYKGNMIWRRVQNPITNWGDDETIRIINNASTIKDIHGITVQCGTARLRRPIGWLK